MCPSDISKFHFQNQNGAAFAGKYMKFTINKCYNDTVPGIICKSDEEIEEYLSNILVIVNSIEGKIDLSAHGDKNPY